MRERMVATLFALFVSCTGATAEDCERFKLHGVHLGDTQSEIREMHGKPHRYHNWPRLAREDYKFDSSELIALRTRIEQDPVDGRELLESMLKRKEQ